MEVLEFILSSPALRTMIEGIALKVVADVFHRRATDPNFLTESDAAFLTLSNAKTDEDKANALKAIQSLITPG